MTTKIYIIAYPHPGIPPHHRVLPLRLGLGAHELSILEQLYATFPDQRGDFKLRVVDLWKATRSAVAQLPP